MMQPPCQLLPARLAASQAIFHSASRAYATAAPTPEIVKNPLKRRKGSDLGSHLPKHIIPRDAYIPPYPHGEYTLFKQANRGLYGGQRIQFGNNVSRKTETKTRRSWMPNILNKSLYSVVLKKRIKLRITSKVLKTVDYEGGLDEYLLKDSERRIKELGPLGWALRWTLLQRPEVHQRMRARAAELGVDQATIDAQWPKGKPPTEKDAAQQGYVRADELIAEEYEDVEENEENGTPARHELARTKREAEAIRVAKKEYTTAHNCAKRYMDKRLVDDQEAALKLAFIRVKDRKDAREDARTKHKRDVNTKPIDESPAQRRAKYAQAIQEAENAGTNEALDRESIDYLQTALVKADRAIKADANGGIDAYVAMRLADLQISPSLKVSPAGAKEPRASEAEVKEPQVGDAWAALVDANAAKENRPQV